MNAQINVRLPTTLLTHARKHATAHGYGTVQELIKESLREKLFDDEFTKKELAHISRRIKQLKERKDFGTEEELFKILRQP